MGNSTVSVIIPTYNRAPTIARAVVSALNQCEANDEVIVIDDGSTDDTEQALRFLMGKIKYHRVQNGGPGYARNIGLKIAQNELIAFLDSDDEWIPGKLSLQRSLLDAMPELAFCFSDLIEIHQGGREKRRVLAYYHGVENLSERFIGSTLPLSTIIEPAEEWKGVNLHIGDLYLAQLNTICVQVNTTLLRRSSLGEDIRFSEDLSYHEDWEFFSRISRQRPVAFLNCETAKLYFHNLPQLTKTKMINIYINRLKVINRVWGEDEIFLREYKNDFIKRKKEQQIELLEELIDRGMLVEAKDIIKNIENKQIKYICIYYLPNRAIHSLLFIYRKTRWLFSFIDQFKLRTWHSCPWVIGQLAEMISF